MSIGRGLLTEGERKYLRGESGDQRMYEARSRYRTRINEEVTEDVELLDQHQPELLDELREIICEGD
jgi:Glu-tRNA(Gln) amidotransferase subunit E-like FAD-binding protein